MRSPSQGTVRSKMAQAFKALSCAALSWHQGVDGWVQLARGRLRRRLCHTLTLPSLAFPATQATPQPHTEPQIWGKP